MTFLLLKLAQLNRQLRFRVAAQLADKLTHQLQALGNLSDTHLDTRFNIARCFRNHIKIKLIINTVADILAAVTGTAAGTRAHAYHS